MKRLWIPVIGLIMLPALLPARPQVDLGISISDGRLRSFYLAVGDHYGIPPREVVLLRDRYRLADEDLPVVYFLAARARVAPSVIIDLRVGRMSWLDIAFRFGLTPDVFFVPVTAAKIGPPYGNAYGHYRKYGPGRDWRKVVLIDREVVDLVNLRFMSEYHKMTPEAVMDMRARGRDFVVIHDEIGKAKLKNKGRSVSPDAGLRDKGKDKAKGKGKGKNKG